jgi:IS30 family transposase
LAEFKHLSLEEREKLFLWNETGVSFREIGRRLKRDHKTISYEIEQNTKYGRKYLPCIAQRRAERVSLKQRYQAPLKGPEIFLYVREKLRCFWTPDMISGRIGIDTKGSSIDGETIYRYIYSKKLWRYLPTGRRKRMKKLGRKIRNKGKVPNAVSIDLRSKVAGRRKQPGHWETDNIEGPRSSRPALSVTVERAVRFHVVSKIPNQTASVKSKALVERLSMFPGRVLRSITQDNGKENYSHEVTGKILGTKMYFCHPYHSWEKGTVENRNKALRRFFPKGTDFTYVSEEEVKAVENILNNQPMRCLGYLKPYEKMQKVLSLVNR